VRNNKTSGELEVYTKMAGVPVPGFRKYWTQKVASLKSQCHAITKKYPAAASVVQQVHEALSDIENLPSVRRLKWGKALTGPLLCIERRKTEQTFVRKGPSAGTLTPNFDATNVAQRRPSFPDV
jgi:hypothetical protein